MDKKLTGVKIIGTIVTIVGLLASFAGAWIDDKKMEETIHEEVAKALAEHKEES